MRKLLVAFVTAVALAGCGSNDSTPAPTGHAEPSWMVNYRNPGLTSSAIAVTNACWPNGTGAIDVGAAAVLWWRRVHPDRRCGS